MWYPYSLPALNLLKQLHPMTALVSSFQASYPLLPAVSWQHVFLQDVLWYCTSSYLSMDSSLAALHQTEPKLKCRVTSIKGNFSEAQEGVFGAWCLCSWLHLSCWNNWEGTSTVKKIYHCLTDNASRRNSVRKYMLYCRICAVIFTEVFIYPNANTAP